MSGNPIINAMHTYDLELGANDYANSAYGLPNGIMIYDVPNDDFAGMSMNEDGSGGYLAIGTRDIAPLDTFQLLKVGQIGGN